MLTRERKGKKRFVIVLLRASFFCPNLAFCWMFKTFVTILEN